MHQLPEVTVADTGFAKPEAGLLSTRLKEATTTLHDEIEHGSEVNQRIVMKVQGDVADMETQRNAYRATYLQFLKVSYGFEYSVIRAAEDFFRLNDLQTYGYFPETADASVLIREDIEVLTDRQQQLKTPSDFPKIRTLADLAGVEYVRRGSRNGNSYIAHAVRGNLGIGPENGAAYLNLDRGKTRPNWEKFKSWLDSLDLIESEKEQAIQAAMETFRAVGKWHIECCK